MRQRPEAARCGVAVDGLDPSLGFVGLSLKGVDRGQRLFISVIPDAQFGYALR